MSTALACSTVAERNWTVRYLAGTLTPDEEDQFEQHLLGCAHCADELRFAAAVGGSLSPAHSRSRFLVPAIGTAAAAALLVLAFNVFSTNSGTAVARLGELDGPPIYLGMAARSDERAGDSLFAAAMQSYAAGDYAAAARVFEEALAAGADAPPVEFFQATSMLMSGRAREAADLYARVIAHGATPYLPESHYYRAKALLRLGRADDALAHLRWLGAQDHELADHARALADSVETVQRR